MSQNLSSPSPMQPLSIGNVVTAGVRLYRSHLKTYLRLALEAHLWLLIPIYGWAKYAAISALISRMAFAELTNQPESVKTARSSIKPRLWSFLRIIFQVGCSLLLVYVGLLIVGGIVGGIIGLILSLLLNNTLGSSAVSISTVVIILLVLVIFLVGFTWFYSRWIIAEVPLAVEENTNGAQSVARSWDLTKTSVLRIQSVVLVAFLITLPLLILFSYLPQLFLLRFEPSSTEYTIMYFFAFILSFIGGIFVMPFWQVIKAVLYYDLRIRREGLGLKLRNYNI